MDEEPKVPPLRPLDDFLIGGARFGPPDFKNQEKWNNRVIQNLMYYQSNYFVSILVVVLLCFYLQPSTMLFGIFLFSIASIYFVYAFRVRKREMENFNKEHPLGYVAVVIFSTIIFLYMVPKMAFFLLSVLFPVLLMLIHASFRMRNFANKVQNKVEAVGLKKTLMGQALKMIFQNDF